MTDYGVEVAQSGKSARSQAILDAILNSKYPFLKAFKQGTVSVTITGAGTFTADVQHGLGYYPLFIHLAAPDPANPSRKFLGRFEALSPGGDLGIDSYVTKELLHLGWKDSSAAPGGYKAYPYVVTFYYYIFYDKIE